jgi:hypothetical protein
MIYFDSFFRLVLFAMRNCNLYLIVPTMLYLLFHQSKVITFIIVVKNILQVKRFYLQNP